MEPKQSLFSLSIDPVTKDHLRETVKWSRMLSICGMIFLVMGVILGLSGIWFSSLWEAAKPAETSQATRYMGLFMAIYMFIIAVIWFFPLLYLFRYSNMMRTALNGNDQQALNTSFQNLKMCMRYVGIVTIILLGVTIIGIVLTVAGVSSLS